MSIAGEYAARMSASNAGAEAAEATKPPSWQWGLFTASVGTDGGLMLDRDVALPVEQAIQFAAWIVATFV